MPARTPERIAVVRALLGLGDMLCIVPALRALRASLPKAEVVVVGLSRARPVLSRFPQYVDRLMELPGWPGLPETAPEYHRIPAFLGTALAERFDLALQMHGNGAVTNQLTALLGAPVTAGYYLPGTWCPDAERYLPWMGRQPEVRRWLDLLEHLGMPLRGEYLEFPIFSEDRAAFERIASTYGLVPGEYVCVHPGAGADDRRWPVEHFAKAADFLASNGFQVVLTGTDRERYVNAMVADSMRAVPLDLSGQTDLGTLGAALEGARLLLCNDTGVSHVAAALGVPSVVVFTASDPLRWAPPNRRLHRVVQSQPKGRLGVWQDSENAVEAVLAEVEALLARTDGTALMTKNRRWE